MAGPFWFDDYNFWKQKGAQTLATAGGHIGGAGNEQFIEARVKCKIPFHATSGQFCGAGAVYGELTDPDDPEHFGFEPPLIRITAGKNDANMPDGCRDVYGWESLDNYDICWQSGDVNLVADAVDAGQWLGAYPPYVDTLDYVRVMLYFRKNRWGDGRTVFVGDWYVELYELTSQMSNGDPGNGAEDPVVACPPRPPWPYRDPVRMISVPDSGRIRRSRP
jgi:hypothetical protein